VVDPQPLGDREHELPVRHLGADVLGHLPAALRLAQAGPTGFLQRPPLVARRAERTSQRVLQVSVHIVDTQLNATKTDLGKEKTDATV
jgi:hypothetical protein